MEAMVLGRKAKGGGVHARECGGGVSEKGTSPMAPARESGLTNKMGTAVVTTLYFKSFCAETLTVVARISSAKLSFFMCNSFLQRKFNVYI